MIGEDIQAEDIIRIAESDEYALKEWKVRQPGAPGPTVRHAFALELLAENSFLTFNDTKEIFRYNLDTGLYEPAENLILARAQAFFGKHTTTHLSTELANTIRRSTFTNREQTNKPHLIPLNNGFYDIKTKLFTDYSPVIPFFVKHPINYDPLALCPAINKFMYEVAENDTEKTWVLIRIAAYCLYRDYPFQKAFMLYGGGANGKSVYLSLLMRILGHQNIVQIPLQELVDEKFARSRLYQKNANIFADLESRALKSTGIFKALTGGDYITCDRKYMDPFEFRNYAKLIFSCNQLPRVQDESDAFFRRWAIISFTHKFEWKDQDQFILDKLCTPGEMSGFLNQMLDELHGLMEEREFGLENEHDTAKIRDLYMRLSDSTKFFCFEKLTISPISQLTKEEIWTGYIEFCGKQKVPAQSEKAFWKSLYFYFEGKSYEFRPLIDGERVRCIKGVEWKARFEDEELKNENGPPCP